MFNRFKGLDTRIYAPGVHWKLPFFEKPIFLDVSARATPVDVVAASVAVKCVVKHRPDEAKLFEICRTLGPKPAQFVATFAHAALQALVDDADFDADLVERPTYVRELSRCWCVLL